MRTIRPPRGPGRASTATHGATFRSLQVRNFRLFVFGQTISQAGNWMQMVAQSLLVLELTHNGVAVGVMTAFQVLPMIVVGPWAGLVADRSNKRRLLLITQCFWMLQAFAFAALTAAGDPPLAALYVLALCGGVGQAFDAPARRSFVVEMVPESSLTNAVSMNTAIMTGSRVVGPLLAGLVITFAGFSWAFALNGLSFIPVIAAYLAMRQDELHAPPLIPRAKGQVREGFRYVLATPDLLIPLVMLAFVGALAWSFQVVYPLFVTQTFHGNELDYTLLFAVLSLGSLFGSLSVARHLHVTLRFVVFAALGFGVTLVFFALSPTLAFAFVVAIAVGVTSMRFFTAGSAIVQLRASPQMRGRVLALQSMVFVGSTPLGGPLLGWICDQFGARTGVMVGAVGALASAVFGYVAARRRHAWDEHCRAVKETPALQPATSSQ